MIIKLKNAVKEHEGKSFLLNSDIIMTVYEASDEDGNPAVFVAGTNDKIWRVQDTVDEIFKMVKSK